MHLRSREIERERAPSRVWNGREGEQTGELNFFSSGLGKSSKGSYFLPLSFTYPPFFSCFPTGAEHAAHNSRPMSTTEPRHFASFPLLLVFSVLAVRYVSGPSLRLSDVQVCVLWMYLLFNNRNASSPTHHLPRVLQRGRTPLRDSVERKREKESSKRDRQSFPPLRPLSFYV